MGSTKTASTGWIDSGPVFITTSVYDSSDLIEAFATASANASASRQYVIRLAQGTYTLTSILVAPNYTTVIGSGRESTIIVRTTTLANSVTSPTGISRDPVINGTSSIKFRLENLKILHSGSSSSGFNPCALSLSDATYFSASNIRLESNDTTMIIDNTAVASSQDESTDFYFWDSYFVNNNSTSNSSNDTMVLGRVDVFFYNCFVINVGNSNQSTDTIRALGGHLYMKGCDIILRFTGTAATSSSCLALVALSSGVTTYVYLDGCRLLADCSIGDFNSSTSDFACVKYRNNGSLFSTDFNLYATGTKFHYLTGTITSCREVGAFCIDAPSTNGTVGNVYLEGCDLRDIGGSGGTNRADVIIDLNTNKMIKQFKYSGTRIASWLYRTTGSPVPLVSNHAAEEQSLSFQGATGTFASAATFAVTLPLAYAASGSDYTVCLEPQANETFWVTSKTNTGFTINSSNAASTATFRYFVKR